MLTCQEMSGPAPRFCHPSRAPINYCPFCFFGPSGISCTLGLSVSQSTKETLLISEGMKEKKN